MNKDCNYLIFCNTDSDATMLHFDTARMCLTRSFLLGIFFLIKKFRCSIFLLYLCRWLTDDSSFYPDRAPSCSRLAMGFFIAVTAAGVRTRIFVGIRLSHDIAAAIS